MFNIFLIFCLLSVTPTEPIKTRVNSGHIIIDSHNPITLNRCGLPPTKCFEWHKTIIELSNEKLVQIGNGSRAVVAEFPWMASLQSVRTYPNGTRPPHSGICGGAVLNQRWIITAAHCVHQFSLQYVRVRVGSIEKFSGGDLLEIERTVAHPEYERLIETGQRSSYNYDIGLVKTVGAINTNGHSINGVCLPVRGLVNSDIEMAFVSGFGHLNRSRIDTLYLNKLDVGLIAHHTCVRRFGFLNLTQFNILCAATKSDSHVICDEDSGSTVVQYVNGRAVIVGVVSSVEEPVCSSRIVTVRVSKYVDWILSVILSDRS